MQQLWVVSQSNAAQMHRVCKSPGILLKGSSDSAGPGQGQDSTFLTSSPVMPVLLVQGPHREERGFREPGKEGERLA